MKENTFRKKHINQNVQLNAKSISQNEDTCNYHLNQAKEYY